LKHDEIRLNRHCERSEAIHLAARTEWIASSLSLLAMTARSALEPEIIMLYIDRILRGANPAELPVQAPTEFELVVNQTAAKQLGLRLPPTLLTRADQVIE
jgi:hypothetical protein